jgi:hypothetical protein
MKRHVGAFTMAAVAFAFGMGSITSGYAADQGGGKSQKVQPGMKTNEPEDLKLRGKPGINAGGQVIPPDEGEQSGKPGTIFGGSATLPPEDRAPGYEGADKGEKAKTRVPNPPLGKGGIGNPPLGPPTTPAGQ